MFNRNLKNEFPSRNRSTRQARTIDLEKAPDGVWRMKEGAAGLAVRYLKKFRWSSPGVISNNPAASYGCQ